MAIWRLQNVQVENIKLAIKIILISAVSCLDGLLKYMIKVISIYDQAIHVPLIYNDVHLHNIP